MPDILTYKHIDGFDLNLHVFFPPDHDRSQRRPAIVFFFGGGWMKGTPTQFYPHCEYLFLISIGYLDGRADQKNNPASGKVR